MALKSVLEIGVEDSGFREFQSRFERYQEALKAMPGAWGEVAKGTGGASAAFDTMAKKMQAQAVASRLNELAARRAADLMKRADYDALSRLDKIRKGTESWGNAVGKVAGQWKAVATYSAKSGVNLASATVSLLKWTSALGIASALIGAGGGLFGIDRLAASAAASRRQSLATGVPIGRQTAFDTEYARYGDTGAITGNVATAKGDATSAQYLGLRGAGISDAEIRRKDAADLSVELFDKLPQLFRKGADDPLFGPSFEARGLGALMSPEDAKRFLRASPKERQAQRDAYGKDQAAFEVDGGTSRAWQDLTTQLERAKNQIEATFITGLVPLAGPIGDASKAFSDLTAAFLKSDVVKSGIEGLAGGLESAAKYVSTPEFKDDVKSFADNVGVLAGKIRAALEWLGIIPSKGATLPDPKGEHDLGGDAAAGTVGAESGAGASLHNRRSHGAHQYTNFDAVRGKVGAFKATSAQQQANAFAITDELRKAGVPDEGIAASLGSAQTESGLNPAVPENSYNHGHHGLWQWDSTRWPKVAAWIRSQGGDPMDARWQTRAHIAEGRAQPGDAIYDSPQTSEGFHKLETSRGDLGRAVEGMRGIERFGRGEEGGRAANAGQWLGHLPTSTDAAATPGPKGTYPDWMDDKSKREMAGINAPLARDLLAASEATGLHFKILQGMRTEAEAAANARKGTGAYNSQHRWGAAADIKLMDAQGNILDRNDPAYERYAQAYETASRAHGGGGRWLGHVPGWQWDRAHFDQGIGYGQSHARDPYGQGGPTKEDIAAANKEIFSGPDNPLLKAAGKLEAAAGAQSRAAGTLGAAHRVLRWFDKGSKTDGPSDTPKGKADPRQDEGAKLAASIKRGGADHAARVVRAVQKRLDADAAKAVTRVAGPHGTYVERGKPLPSWMTPGADGPIRTTDFRDPKYAPKGEVDPILKAAQGGVVPDPAKEAHQHIADLKLLLAVKQHRAFPWQHRDFRAAVQAAKSNAGIERAREEGRREGGPQRERTSGLGGGRFQVADQRNRVIVENASGGNLHAQMIQAGYG